MTLEIDDTSRDIDAGPRGNAVILKCSELGEVIKIGHLDTGVFSFHPALKGKVEWFRALDKDGNVSPDEEGRDWSGHGSHTAGIICGRSYRGTRGAAPEARLCSVSVPAGGKLALNLLIGMDLLLDCDIKIVCMALGFAGKTPIFLRMTEAFQRRGILVAAAAGNRGEGTVYSPARYPHTLSVGAADEQGLPAVFSGGLADQDGRGLHPDILAPGVDIESVAANSRTVKNSGTSMAAAYVAGIAARLWNAVSDPDPERIKEALLNTAAPLPSDQRHRCRTGIIRPEAALDYLLKEKNRALSPACPPPDFLKRTYIDPRLASKLRRAGADDIVEAVVIPREPAGMKRADRRNPATGAKLIEEAGARSGSRPGRIRFFRNADMACVKAGRAFYRSLFKLDYFFAAGAADISIFNI